MNIFQKIKAEVDFLQAMEHYIGPLKQCGDDTYTTDADECPIHGGHGCFRMKYDGENSLVTCFGNCDHTDWPLDLIGFVQVHLGLETVGEAARKIANDFDVKMPVENATSRIMRAAQGYYRDMFELNIKKLKQLGKKSPLEYQMEVRQHKKSTLDAIQIGWSDGGLTEFLEDDFTPDELVKSGLVKEFRGKLVDVLPAESFIYPHFWSGRISRFSFKHKPSIGKTLHFNIKKMYWLNEIEFFSVGSGTPVAIVEGEDDLASLLDYGWPGTVMCSNGSLSKEQIEWISNNPTEYHTYWDGDTAGLGYMEKMWKPFVTGKVPDLHQWMLPVDTDIDDYLKQYKLEDLVEATPPERSEVITIKEKSGLNVIEENGCYKVVKYSEDLESEQHIAITDFTIRLLYVKVQGEERSRVIRIIRNDGRKSRAIVVNSEAKVSIRHWKILVANAVDASFIGNELELAAMWGYVYSTQREAVVDVPPHVGNMEGEGWLFSNQYIGPEGDIKGDDDNIMWFDEGKTKGVAPKSLMASLSSSYSSADIPNVWKGENTEEFIGDICYNLNEILKDPGMVLCIMGWLRSCAYSMPLFYEAKLKFFPFLLLWGRHGKGKSTLANWMLSFYDMADKGTTTVGQLRSGVGIERKLAYYRGLPYCIDELRADRQASEYSRTWRGWYNRSSRVKGTRKNEDIIQVPLNACLFFSGQDTFTDPAMRSRCISCKFPSNAGDTPAYNWMEDEVDQFPTVGYHWVREAMNSNIHEVMEGINEFKDGLKNIAVEGIPSRAIANYAVVSYFAQDMAKDYFPDFDFLEWLSEAMADEQVEAVENDMVSHFWDGVAGLQVGERATINGNHILVQNGKMYIWYAEAFKAVANSIRTGEREAFSKGAVRNALVEESYYAGTGTIRMGATNSNRRCMIFNVEGDNIPHEILAIAETARNAF